MCADLLWTELNHPQFQQTGFQKATFPFTRKAGGSNSSGTLGHVRYACSVRGKRTCCATPRREVKKRFTVWSLGKITPMFSLVVASRRAERTYLRIYENPISRLPFLVLGFAARGGTSRICCKLFMHHLKKPGCYIPLPPSSSKTCSDPVIRSPQHKARMPQHLALLRPRQQRRPAAVFPAQWFTPRIPADASLAGVPKPGRRNCHEAREGMVSSCYLSP